MLKGLIAENKRVAGKLNIWKNRLKHVYKIFGHL